MHSPESTKYFAKKLMRTQKYVQKQTWVQFCTHAQSIKNLIDYFSTSSFLRLSLGFKVEEIEAGGKEGFV